MEFTEATEQEIQESFQQTINEIIDKTMENKTIEHTLKGCGFPQSCFIDPIEDYLICGICLDVVRNPQNLECPHLFCEKCISQLRDLICPTCRTSIEELSTLHFINQLVWNKNIRCPHHDEGCTWTGTIGIQERNLKEHLKLCSWGGFKKCEMCSVYICKSEEKDHKTTCIEEEDECECCGEKMKRKMLTIHRDIGVLSGKWCENTSKCRFGCSKYIRNDEVEKHEDTECEGRFSICYACEKVHTIPFYKLLNHISNEIKTTQQAQKYMERVNGYPTGRVGSLVDVLFPPTGQWKVAELLAIRDIAEEEKFNETREVQLRLLDTDTTFWIYYYSIKKLGTHTSKDLIIPYTPKIKNTILDCLKRFECTISVVPENNYELQPFYSCSTCSGYTYNHDSGGIVGCCAVCAVSCHQGHTLVLNHVSRSKCYCDCGIGDMKDSHGRPIVCCAPKSVVLVPRVRSTAVLNVEPDEVPWINDDPTPRSIHSIVRSEDAVELREADDNFEVADWGAEFNEDLEN